jgi:vacuolar-type H+-ATPase subunit I/STV1
MILIIIFTLVYLFRYNWRIELENIIQNIYTQYGFIGLFFGLLCYLVYKLETNIELLIKNTFEIYNKQLQDRNDLIRALLDQKGLNNGTT